MSDTCHWEDLDAKRAAITSAKALALPGQDDFFTDPGPYVRSGANTGWEVALDKMRQEFDARLQKLETSLVTAAASGPPAVPQASTSRSQQPSTYKQASNGQIRLKGEAISPPLAGGKEEEAEDAAIALEALAAGHTPNNMSPVDTVPTTSKEAFARESILDRHHVNPSPVSPKLPWTMGLSVRTVVDALLGITQSKAVADRLLHYYVDNISSMQGVSSQAF
jgi:hypothetical protein